MPPVGYKRSRALWEQTKRPEASWNDWLKAFLYELQPIRFSRSSQQESLQWLRSLVDSIILAIRSFPLLVRHVVQFLGARTRRQWMIVGGVVVYYLFVRWIHNLLHAGPIVIIATSLCIIFSFGLSDSAEQNGISAYSVFNRGFERLMGAVDADALVAQHVGGGMAMGAAAMPAVVAPPPRQRANARQPPPARAQLVQPENAPPREEGEEAPAEEENQARPNRARRSGKKNRRRMEQRQELRRQREAAAAFGLNGAEDEQEMMAMQRLLEEQIAAENA
eukprot:Nitzschia sp. Nitz4//scaffold128_size63911//34336//35241//NITZ4_006221-RA/size63911-snap-gene-0.68-mRNA-1//-1//CDS//3329534838//4414//frame0